MAALRVLGIDASTPNPPGGLIARDASGNPTGLFLAEPNAYILYSTIARAPKLSFAEQINSSRWNACCQLSSLDMSLLAYHWQNSRLNGNYLKGFWLLQKNLQVLMKGR